jgi:hypothetical protein
MLAAMLIDALHAALEDGEIAFHGVAVDRTVGQIVDTVTTRALPLGRRGDTMCGWATGRILPLRLFDLHAS